MRQTTVGFLAGLLPGLMALGLTAAHIGLTHSSSLARDSGAALTAKHLALAKRLVAAYPEHLKGIDGGDLIWHDGSRMPLDDGRRGKSFNQLLTQPDLLDQFAFPYRRGKPATNPDINEDPGRIRYQPFFEKMYGDCKKGEVNPRLEPVDWLPNRNGGRLMVTSVNGVADKLRAVSRDLEKLPARFTPFMRPSAGVYSCRVIAGTKRKSVHAYGAAIDINVEKSNYWRWSKPDKNGVYPYRNKIPQEIVDVFERHGFIWGGKWYHYDTMHFEYRPELLNGP